MAATWEELEQKFGGAVPRAAASADPWAELEAEFTTAAPPTLPRQTVKSVAELPKREAGAMDRVKAAAAGVNKGFFSDLLGLPVDTVANVVDLVKAGYGTAVTAAGRPDLAPELMDRSGVIGSSAWLDRQINNGGMGAAINNPVPDDGLSRILYTTGRVGGASIVPSPKVPISGIQQARNISAGAVSGATAGTVGEVAPEYAGVAGTLPATVRATGSAAFKRSIRGDEAGRRNMEQRVQDFKNAGVDAPSVGLASGNQFVQGMENLLAQTPGSVGLYQRASQANTTGMQNRTNRIRDDISPSYGASETGAAIQSDLRGPFKERVQNTYGALNDRVERIIGADTVVPATNSINTTSLLTTPVKGAEATSSNFINAKIGKIGKDLQTDSGGMPATTTNSLIVGPNGRPAFQTVTPAVAPTGVPFSALKTLRTRIGQEAASKNIMATPQEAEFKLLYGGMSDDMRQAAINADRMLTGGQASQPATTSLNRANGYYSSAMDRIGNLNTLANRNTPESAYNSVATSLQSGPTTYARVRNAVQPETRQKIAATVIDDLGRAKPGQQTADGDAWSPATFLTNYSKLDQKAKTALFTRLPGGKTHADNLSDIAKAAEMIGQGSKIWANPSGTGAALSARGTFGAIGLGAFYQPIYAAGAAGSLLGANAASRLFLSPIFVNWLAKAPKNNPAKLQSYMQRLVINAQSTKDAQFQQDVATYVQSVEQPLE